MGFRFLPSGFARRFRADIQTLLCRRIRGGPSLAARALALDRIAGAICLVCMAGAALWIAGHAPPVNLLQAPLVSESAQADSGAADRELREAAGTAADALSPEDIRKLQNWLMMHGFDPGPIDGIAGRGTLSAFNQYRASRDLSEVSRIDRADLAELLN